MIRSVEFCPGFNLKQTMNLHHTFPGFIQNLSGWEIPIILLVLIFFVGGKRLPELARGIGQSIVEFKKASRETTSVVEDSKSADPKQA